MQVYRSNVAPSVLGRRLGALVARAGLPVFWCSAPARAAREIESLSEEFVLGIVKVYWTLATDEGGDGSVALALATT